MRSLKERTQGLVMLTATPMQVHPVEVWDLLDLLGLPPEWTERAFLEFFETVDHPNPSNDAMERMAALFRAVESEYGDADSELVARLTKLSGLKGKRVLGALRDESTIPRRRLETVERRQRSPSCARTRPSATSSPATPGSSFAGTSRRG